MAKIQTMITVVWLMFGFLLMSQNVYADERLIGFVVTNATTAKDQLTCNELNYMVRFNKWAHWWADNKPPTIVLYSAADYNHRMISMNCFELMPVNLANMLVARGYVIRTVNTFPYDITGNYLAFSAMGVLSRNKRIRIVE